MILSSFVVILIGHCDWSGFFSYYTPEEAVEAKLADEVLKTNKRMTKYKESAGMQRLEGSCLALIKTKLRGVGV